MCPGSRKLVWRIFAEWKQEVSSPGDSFLLFSMCRGNQRNCSLLPAAAKNPGWPTLAIPGTSTTAASGILLSSNPALSHCFSPVQLLPLPKFISQLWEWWKPFGMQFILTAITFHGLEEWKSCCHSPLRAYFLTVKQVTFLWPAKKAFAFLLCLVILQLSNPPCFMEY